MIFMYFQNEAIPNAAAQNSVHPTGGSLRVFKQFVWLEAGSIKMALPRPAHQRVTQTVSLLIKNDVGQESIS